MGLRLPVPMKGGDVPELWLLGSSPSTSVPAAELDMRFAFARHLRPELTSEADLVSVSVICTEDDERAEWLAGPIRTRVRSRQEGDRILPPARRTRPRSPTTAACWSAGPGWSRAGSRPYSTRSARPSR
ncbi:hypothetical protein [Lentzea albidocapillata]|uniref:Uncharacterized protein n=1 Tax=Lentzea albidocapillata TaxID=40571 RepID=A0A1W2D055_9PSEU|nr:hypothetical protein [Lentzea albidocapillata]SMC90820.1 hypothetical protein SAMN05660733_02594 [Lentzea albidocapillata]